MRHAIISILLCWPALADGIFMDFAGDQEVMSRTFRTAPLLSSTVAFSATVQLVNPNIDDALAIKLQIIRPVPLLTFTITSDGPGSVGGTNSDPMTGGVSMSWQSRSNVAYTIQASGDLVTWTNCWHTNGSGRRITNNWPPSELACFYRFATN